MIPVEGLLWLLLVLGPLLFAQRLLHRSLQAVLLLMTRRMDLALAFFSLLFLPGVALHEGSHYLTAILLGVRTGRFSLLPRPTEDGRLQLGFVETAAVDFIRDALIGAAPLVSGSMVVAWIGSYHLGLAALWDSLTRGNAAEVFATAASIPHQADFWLWFYLAFAVSSTMLPSPADRRAWWALLAAIVALLGLAALVGGSSWILLNVLPMLDQALRALAIALGISALLHLALLLPVYLLQQLLSHATGMQVS